MARREPLRRLLGLEGQQLGAGQDEQPPGPGGERRGRWAPRSGLTVRGQRVPWRQETVVRTLVLPQTGPRGQLGVRSPLWPGSALLGPAQPRDEPGGSCTSHVGVKVGLPQAGSWPPSGNSGTPRSADRGCPLPLSGQRAGGRAEDPPSPNPLLLSPGLISASKWHWPSGDSAETSRARRSGRVLN